ncbi:Anaphase-promoting complex subunit 13 [Wickerhamomyces ciferrii]|uniref:Anaphase-promoting complex subunit 13 n=1 Tax=Wickerhamomyces ciferrii (strain ATCC 14091 / BCRC 22168 / CBS 111 / JCM 3599 / NBRC 0793 / NRRL Y-1031 F-60-10) TaxID=1206466 RepID=K0KH47_WICCF|nr:Anaphase-promoting complex subunit 13 [Wickerhamomyces ciferrii]CCH41507.1 Anaphase-promoting complex subunit 13 [Wickerhamomyces ciferrii]
MAYRDSSSSFIHLQKSQHALYITGWVHDELPDEDIEVPGAQIGDEDEEDSPLINQNIFGILRSQQKNKTPVWKDLDVHKFLNDNTKAIEDHHDDSLFKKIDNLYDFEDITPMNQNEQAKQNESHVQQESNRSASLPSFEFTTPMNVSNINKTTQRNQNFQTPAARILR